MAITTGLRSPHRDLPELPRGCTAKLVGEGAANVVFELSFQDRPPHFLQGKLLRVPKAGKDACTYTELQAYWEHEIKLTFGDYQLVNQSLVDLSSSCIIRQLNEVLAEEDNLGATSRRKDFIGCRIDNVREGMLVEDMRALYPNDVVIEFKPKWLTQSPSAPKNAKRCRTCAREAYREAKGLGKRRAFCPLDLLRTDDEAALETLARTLAPSNVDSSSQQYRLFKDWLRTNDLLPALARKQQQLDRCGILSTDTYDPDLQLAMAIRDCTCFVRIPGDMANGSAAGTNGNINLNGSARKRVVEAKLGDIDKKHWDNKLRYWQNIEEKLCKKGYYMGDEGNKKGKTRVKTNCVLER